MIGWRLRDLMVEASRNLVPSRSRGAVAVFISVVVGAALAWALGAATVQYRADEASEALAGAQVVVLGSDSDPGAVLISQSSCEELALAPIVAASGVVTGRSYQAFPGLGLVSTVEASTTLIPIGDTDILLGAALADSAGLGPDGRLLGPDGRGYPYTVAVPQPAGIDINGSVVIPAAGQRWTRVCIVRLEDGARAETTIPMLLAQLDYDRSAPVTVSADPRSGDATTRYLAGPFRPFTLGVSALVGGCLGFFRRLRPADAVSYRLAGMTRLHQIILHLLEDGTCGALLAASGIAVLAMIEPSGMLLLAHAFWLAAAGMTLTLGAMSAGLLVVLPNPIALGADQ